MNIIGYLCSIFWKFSISLLYVFTISLFDFWILDSLDSVIFAVAILCQIFSLQNFFFCSLDCLFLLTPFLCRSSLFLCHPFYVLGCLLSDYDPFGSYGRYFQPEALFFLLPLAGFSIFVLSLGPSATWNWLFLKGERLGSSFIVLHVDVQFSLPNLIMIILLDIEKRQIDRHIHVHTHTCTHMEGSVACVACLTWKGRWDYCSLT